MKLCRNCMGEKFEFQENEFGEFPSFTVLGSILGAAATAFTGMLLLIPFGVFVGAATDVSCELCGAAEDEGIYELMEERETDDSVIFLPHRPPEIEPRTPPEIELNESPDFDSPAYAFDESVGGLVPVSEAAPSKEGNATASSYGWSIGAGFDLGEGVGGEGASPSSGAPAGGGEGSGGTGSAGGAGGSAGGGE